MTAQQRPMPVTSQDLCQAINNDQLHVHYQPKIDMRTGLVRSMEVLARWMHPELGPIPPDQFVALAEKNHLIFDLTLQILRKCIDQAATWQHAGFFPKLAINLSPLLLEESSIVETIEEAAASQDLAAQPPHATAATACTKDFACASYQRQVHPVTAIVTRLQNWRTMCATCSLACLSPCASHLNCAACSH